MSDFFGSFRKKKHNATSGATSPRSSIDSSSRRSQGPNDVTDEPMPNSDEQIDDLFDQMLSRRGLDEEKKKPLKTSLDYKTKWAMIVQDRKAEQVVSGRKPQEEDTEEAQPLISVLSDLAGEMWSATRESTARTIERHSYRHSQLAPMGRRVSEAIQSSNAPSTAVSSASVAYDGVLPTDKNSPEFYIRKFMEADLRAVTPALADNLAVSLRTRPLDWVIRFTDLKGLRVVSHGLSFLNKKPDAERKGQMLELEYGLIKCIKVLINARWGAREAILNPEYIHSMVFSIVCPQWQARKVICDILLFLCHCDVPLGHHIVMQGFDLLRQHRQEFGVFDAWIKDFEHTLDGTHRVGRSNSIDEYQKLGVFVPPDSHLIEYCLSNVGLINALVYIPTEANDRIYFRSQFKLSGLDRVFAKLEKLDDPALYEQMDKYRRRAESDLDEAFGDELSMYSDISQPNELLELILENISDAPNALDFLLQTFRSMLLIKGDADRKTHYHQAISEIVSNIVMDRRESVTADELGSSAFGFSVSNMIGRFNELDRLQELARTAEEDREMALRLGAENKALKDEIETLKKATHGDREGRNYKLENIALRALQQQSNKTITMLQERLKEKTEDLEEVAMTTPSIVVGEQWKLAGRRPDNTLPLSPLHKESTSEPHMTEDEAKQPPTLPQHGDTDPTKDTSG
ncbi:hypothetical protein CU098_001177, partial [Rhizopus stolonifer]